MKFRPFGDSEAGRACAIGAFGTRRADLEAVTRVYLGQLGLADARRCGLLEIEGPRELARGVDAWFPVSGFAAQPPAHFHSFGAKRVIRDGLVAQAGRYSNHLDQLEKLFSRLWLKKRVDH